MAAKSKDWFGNHVPRHSCLILLNTIHLLPQTLKIGSNYPGYLEIMLVLILLNTTVNPSVDCYDADPNLDP